MTQSENIPGSSNLHLISDTVDLTSSTMHFVADIGGAMLRNGTGRGGPLKNPLRNPSAKLGDGVRPLKPRPTPISPVPLRSVDHLQAERFKYND